MEIPDYQPFYLESLNDLVAELDRLGIELPLATDLLGLKQELKVGKAIIPNRFCALPVRGNDAIATGAPGSLTRRRYLQYAQGQFGLIWFEATSAGSPAQPHQLALSDKTVNDFRDMVTELRAKTKNYPVLILQLESEIPTELIKAANLAAEAGFDGIDLSCSRENLSDVIAEVKTNAPDLLLTTRLCIYEAVRGGFGVSANDFREPDMTEPIQFIRQLSEQGLDFINATANSPVLGGPDRGSLARQSHERLEEHSLLAIERYLHLTQELNVAVPDMPLIGSGFSWLRHFIPQVAAGAIESKMIDLIGLGRAALAQPSTPATLIETGSVEAGSGCMVCFACSKLQDEGEPVGCVIRDPETYGSGYRQVRRFDGDLLQAGAARCHFCEFAPCVQASPTRTDIPGFIRAYLAGDEDKAFEIIRESDPLPELTSRLSPGWMEREGACIQTSLSGSPVPILDLQYVIAWRARDAGKTGIQLPKESTGKQIAIIGGGPTGIAAAAELLSLGHEVDLYEKTTSLGGMPKRAIYPHRASDPEPEIHELLSPGLKSGRFRLHLGACLGDDFHLDELTVEKDAVLVATGLWQESSLGKAPGVIAALPFIESLDPQIPDRIALLAGSDSAMDAARIAENRGAKEIFVLFGGPRSEMHWHMNESWFATPGVQAMMNWKPLGYELDSKGHLSGIQIRHTELGTESVLPVGLAIEAMELQVDDDVLAELEHPSSKVYQAGGMINGGASVARCVAEGVATANRIHHDLTI
ncbi:MAG: FAD-dependent oxidoreductase [Verrucomicrobiota bacterium]